MNLRIWAGTIYIMNSLVQWSKSETKAKETFFGWFATVIAGLRLKFGRTVWTRTVVGLVFCQYQKLLISKREVGPVKYFSTVLSGIFFHYRLLLSNFQNSDFFLFCAGMVLPLGYCLLGSRTNKSWMNPLKYHSIVGERNYIFLPLGFVFKEKLQK